MDSKLIDGRMCGTCLFWDREYGTSARSGLIIPNARCECHAEIKIPDSLPFSIQKVSTFCEDGIKCKLWKRESGRFSIMAP